MSKRSPSLGFVGGAGLSVLLHGVAAAAIALYGFGGTSKRAEHVPIPIALVVEDIAAPAPVPAPAPAAMNPIAVPAASPMAVPSPVSMPPIKAPTALRPTPQPPRAKPEASAVLAPPETSLSVIEAPAAVPAPKDVEPTIGAGEDEAQAPTRVAALGSALSGAISGSTGPRLLHAPPPDYPMVARRRGQQGRVLLAVELDHAGVPVEARVKTGSGYGTLDDAALRAVKAWRFDPSAEARRLVDVPIVFRLGD